MDKWDRKTDFGCNSCMFYVPKADMGRLGRCRRNAPTMKGYPVVYINDWCGEHKKGSNPVRDNNEVLQDNQQNIERKENEENRTTNV